MKLPRTPIDPRTGKRWGWKPPELPEFDPVTIANARADRKALEMRMAADKARERFMPFVKFTSPDVEHPHDPDYSRYKNARHHDGVARAIEEVVIGNITFLILEMPPRHGKSELVSRKLPGWYLGKYPHHEVVVGTYGDQFAEDFGDEVRTLINSPRYKKVFPDLRLAKGGAAKDRLKTVSGGGAYFVGRGGSLTGRGAHLLILDDLIKDDKEAQSQAIRDQAWNWFVKVALSRRRGKKLVIMTFTRWHADDPIGRLTDPENPHYSADLASKIKRIRLPAIAGEDDPLGRAPGEALWPDGPDKFDLDYLKEMQAIDPLGFSALYQQEPSAADGILFRRENIKYYRAAELPDNLTFYCASDHAVATGQKNDYTVMLKVGVDRQHNIYLIDCVWRRMRADAAVETMLTMGGGAMAPLLWWAEAGHISKAIGPFLYQRMAETGTYFTVREMHPAADKEQRAQSIAAMVNLGKVYFPVEQLWTEKAINQLMVFPNGTHDDFVDAFAYIGLGLRSQFKPGRVVEKKKDPAFGTLAWVKQQDRWAALQQAAKQSGGF